MYEQFYTLPPSQSYSYTFLFYSCIDLPRRCASRAEYDLRHMQVDHLSEQFADLRVRNHSLRQMVHDLQGVAARAATSSEQSLRLVTTRQQPLTRHVSGNITPHNITPHNNIASQPVTEDAVQRRLQSVPQVGLAAVVEGDAVDVLGVVAPVGEWKDIAVRRVFLGVLDVVLNKATGLKPKMFGTRDPYAVLRMRSVSDMKVWKSSAKSSTRNPSWEEHTSFLVQVYPLPNPPTLCSRGQCQL
jgi:hypothetical protein